LDFLLIFAVGLAAGVVSGIVGTGSSLMLMPVLITVFGPREAVPIMAVAALMANVARVVAWWREVDWRACAAYALPAAPAAALGARTLLVLPPRVVDLCIGGFLIAMIPLRRWMAASGLRLGLWHLAAVGLVIGYVTGIVVSTGPVTVPVFLAYGLVKGAFLATEAAGSLAVYVSKVATFRAFGALPVDLLAKGLLTGGALTAGTFIAKPFLLRIDPKMFRTVMDGLMLAAGIAVVWNAA
jgi:uncharacterized membrane protein YfcA